MTAYKNQVLFNELSPKGYNQIGDCKWRHPLFPHIDIDLTDVDLSLFKAEEYCLHTITQYYYDAGTEYGKHIGFQDGYNRALDDEREW